MATTFPARLHVLLARDAPAAVVIRRGPSDEVCFVGWDRKTDSFTLGQWLRGRIYERRSDLSPDGKHVIYFAMNGHWQSEAKGAWTAISRSPYLHAVTVLPKGDCWNGGGLFVDDNTYWLNNGYGHATLEDSGEVARAAQDAYRTSWGSECPGVYYPRLLRDGWQLRKDLELGSSLASADVFDKPLRHGWTLRKLAHATIGPPEGKSTYYDEHELVGHGRELPRYAWEWADLDGERIVWATKGQLWAGRITAASSMLPDPIAEPRLLHDFNAMTFEAVRAPYQGD